MNDYVIHELKSTFKEQGNTREILLGTREHGPILRLRATSDPPAHLAPIWSRAVNMAAFFVEETKEVSIYKCIWNRLFQPNVVYTIVKIARGLK